MTVTTISQELANLLDRMSNKMVLTESCTCGMIAAQLGKISGVSNCLCGSSVVYRAETKRRWLGISKKLIRKHTTESHEVAEQMAKNVLKRTPEAHWSLGIVGHIGSSAPKDKDGQVFICIVRRTKSGKIKVVENIEHRLNTLGREKRQEEAAEVVLTKFIRVLNKRFEKESHQKRRMMSRSQRKQLANATG